MFGREEFHKERLCVFPPPPHHSPTCRLEIRNAELTESRKSRSRGSARSNVSSEDTAEEGEMGEEVVEEQEGGEQEEEEGRGSKGRLSIALTNCGDVLERQLFDAMFW